MFTQIINKIYNYLSNNIEITILIIVAIVLYLFYPLYKPLFKRKSKSKLTFETPDLDKVSKNIKSEAKKKAIEVLHNFGISYIEKDIAGNKKQVNLSITNPDSVSDGDVIMAFSRLSDETTTFQSDWTRPDGVAGKNETTEIDGIIWGLVYAPDFIRMVVPHSKFIRIWKNEREKKLEMENFIRGLKIDELKDEVLSNSNDYTVTIDNNKYIDYDKLFDVYKEVYERYVFEKFGIKLPNPFDFYSVVAMAFGYKTLLEFDRNAELITLDNATKKIVKVRKGENI